ncbi:MAG: hypothetical protein IPP42_07445 [Saprospiraceae bacterium]|nr:hypothetical protein [Saprospiraceae bacterium]
MKINKTLKLLFSGTLLSIIIMQYTGHPLKVPTTPNGILALEFANTPAKVQSIIDAWQPLNNRGRSNIAQARLNTYWDFVFILFYSSLLYYWNQYYSHTTIMFRFIGKVSGLIAILAGILDIVENLGMFKSLAGNISTSNAQLTSACATIKFCLLAISILTVVWQRVRIWTTR